MVKNLNSRFLIHFNETFCLFRTEVPLAIFQRWLLFGLFYYQPFCWTFLKVSAVCMCQQRDQIAESLFFFFFLLFLGYDCCPIYSFQASSLSQEAQRSRKKVYLSFFVTSNGFGFKENRFVHEFIFCRYVTNDNSSLSTSKSVQIELLPIKLCPFKKACTNSSIIL